MPDLQQAKQAAFAQISELTRAKVEYKIAHLEAIQAILDGKNEKEQNRVTTKLMDANSNLNAAVQQVGMILQGCGFCGDDLEQAIATIRQEVNEEVTRLVAHRLGAEQMEALGLDPDGRPLG